MTNISPNPVDGDVHALIERLNRIAARLKWNSAGYALDVLKAVDLLTTPPAQLLRPVKLPQRADSNRENFYGCSDDFCQGWNHCLEEIKQAVADAGYEVKS
ncbi:hypothetical protein ACTUTK_07190 [Pantoea ananatis]|jgi:hypothetical protein|uniref:hypothetical protein n=1 Tax=Pantoea ananas TaxID=553 RepID=UPI003FA4D3D0